jgi:transposase InsO family protein
MSHDPDPDRWARLRFAIIGPLLAAPPERGELGKALEDLAKRCWKHPVNGTMLQFSYATLERWYYVARKARDPVAVLRRRGRNDAGRTRRMTAALMQAVQTQYQAHPGWSVQLHYDNLAAQAEADEALEPVPGYGTVRRYMKARGLHRKRRPKRKTPGAQQAEERLQSREIRSYEVDHVHGLWHLDYHHGSRKVLTPGGRWVTPLLLGVIDDHSRLVCHLQWYLEETTETLVHGVCQALQKMGLPRAVMTDNGSAMTADEFRSGLHTLGILHETTLPYSAYQNAKQEIFWATVEGRLMAMLEGVSDLDLEQLNTLTQAWVEQDYHQNRHAEIGVTPIRRYLDAPNVGRECPGSRVLRSAFCCTVKRRERRSDGTLSLAGKRFEIPDRYRHMEQPRVRYARWDLRSVELVDPHTQATLCPLYPLDKSANAEGLRRSRAPEQAVTVTAPQQDELPALLRKLVADYAATGRPPAYLPKPPKDPEDAS